LDSDEFDEDQVAHRLSSNPNLALATCWYLIQKLQACFFAGDYATAVEASSKAQQLVWTATSYWEAAEYQFYAALSHAAFYDTALAEQRQQHVDALAAHHQQLSAWEANCPENFENRAALVGAEIARIEGRVLDAEQLYEQAIRSARDNGFVHNEALAYELAARFYAARGFEEVAHVYLINARQGYLRWGADGKVRQLEELYPHLRQDERAPGPTGTIEAPVEQLDLATVIEVSQVLSGEMVLEKLIDRIMCAAIEHAGAERGLLICPRGEEVQIDAEASACGEDVAVHVRERGARIAVALPESLIRYAIRTHETVIIDDASSQNPFSGDPYIVQRRARSILCLPLINQRKFIGILYLENNLTPNVFTPERVTVLKVLASQAAISLKNSRLYRDLAEREAKIRRLVDANIIGIFISSREGEIIEANDAFLTMVGYDGEDLAAGNMRWTELTPPEWRASTARALEAIDTTGAVKPYEKEYLRKDGSRVPVLIGSAAFDERRDQAVTFVLDLTERKRAEAEARESERAHASLSRYFSPEFAKRLASSSGESDGMEVHWRDIAVIFTDIAGFTSLVETAAPEVLGELLNEYVGGMTDVVFAHEGTVAKVMGDGVLVLFNAPSEQPDYASRAIACAHDLDYRAEEFRERWTAKGVNFGVTRIGVHAGPALVGNFGSSRFFDYTAHGDTINTASRLEAANKFLGTRICVSAVVARAASNFQGRPIGDLILRGRSEPLRAFEALPAAAYKAPEVTQYSEAFAKLEAGDVAAMPAFAALVSLHADDPLASFHLKRLLNGAKGVRIQLE
jgi:PAS domain S-box-containing protein